jgi:hypothetical protein
MSVVFGILALVCCAHAGIGTFLKRVAGGISSFASNPLGSAVSVLSGNTKALWGGGAGGGGGGGGTLGLGVSVTGGLDAATIKTLDTLPANLRDALVTVLGELDRVGVHQMATAGELVRVLNREIILSGAKNAKDVVSVVATKYRQALTATTVSLETGLSAVVLFVAALMAVLYLFRVEMNSIQSHAAIAQILALVIGLAFGHWLGVQARVLPLAFASVLGFTFVFLSRLFLSRSISARMFGVFVALVVALALGAFVNAPTDGETVRVLLSQLGVAPSITGSSCSSILAIATSRNQSLTSGRYSVCLTRDQDVAFGAECGIDADFVSVYCDMETNGGGWTLVWANFAYGFSKPHANLKWQDAINMVPTYLTPDALRLSPVNLRELQMYTGLFWWSRYFLAPRQQLLYSWSPPKAPPLYRAHMNFSLDAGNSYAIATSALVVDINQGNSGWSSCTPERDCDNTVGLFRTGSAPNGGTPFSTVDAKHDSHSVISCAEHYNSPWWYTACWDGSIWGCTNSANPNGNCHDTPAHGSGGYRSGAYFVGSSTAYAVAGQNGAEGAGDGLIFVR